MRKFLLLCALWSLNTYPADVCGPKILKIGKDIQSSLAFCALGNAILDSSPRGLEVLDRWFAMTDIKADETYPDAQEFVGKTFVDLAWGGALHYGAMDVFERVLKQIPDISQTKLNGDDLLTAAKVLIEGGELGLFVSLPQSDAASMAKNAPHILEIVERHPTWTKSLVVTDRSLNDGILCQARTYYEVLGIGCKASEEDIRTAYKSAAIKWHPDRNRDNEEIAGHVFKMVGEAYGILSDPAKREKYDRSLSS